MNDTYSSPGGVTITAEYKAGPKGNNRHARLGTRSLSDLLLPWKLTVLTTIRTSDFLSSQGIYGRALRYRDERLCHCEVDKLQQVLRGRS